MKLSDKITVTLSHPTEGSHIADPLFSGGAPDLLFSTKKQKNNIFNRKVLDTTLIFSKADYTWLKAIENDTIKRCRKITLSISSKIQDGTVNVNDIIYTAYISLEDAEIIDYDCLIKTKVRIQDKYTPIDEIYKKKINILDGTPKSEIKHLYSGATVRTETVPTLGNVDFTEGWVTTKWVEFAPDTDLSDFFPNAILVEYSRLEITFATPPPVELGWTQIGTTNNYFKAPKTRALEPVLTSASGFTTRTTDYEIIDNRKAILKINNGVKLSDVLAKILEGTGYTVRSDFFNINPDALAPNNTAYTYANQYLNDPIYFRASSVIDPNSDQDATIHYLTLEEIENHLYNLCQVLIFSDESENNVLRVEHVSYIDNTTFQLDLRTRDNGKWIFRKGAYQYESLKSPITENFVFPVSTGFDGFPFKYNEVCANLDDVEGDTFTPTKLSTDYMDVLQNEDYDIEFSVLASYIFFEGENHLVNLPSSFKTRGQTIFAPITYDSLPTGNGALSYFQLQKNLWIYRRPQSGAIWDGAAPQLTIDPSGNFAAANNITFESLLKRKKQESLTVLNFTLSDWLTLDLNKFIATQIGEAGEMVDVNYSFQNCRLSIGGVLHGEPITSVVSAACVVEYRAPSIELRTYTSSNNPFIQNDWTAFDTVLLTPPLTGSWNGNDTAAFEAQMKAHIESFGYKVTDVQVSNTIAGGSSYSITTTSILNTIQITANGATINDLTLANTTTVNTGYPTITINGNTDPQNVLPTDPTSLMKTRIQQTLIAEGVAFTSVGITFSGADECRNITNVVITGDTISAANIIIVYPDGTGSAPLESCNPTLCDKDTSSFNFDSATEYCFGLLMKDGSIVAKGIYDGTQEDDFQAAIEAEFTALGYTYQNIAVGIVTSGMRIEMANTNAPVDKVLTSTGSNPSFTSFNCM